jgi:hypothetical protein
MPLLDYLVRSCLWRLRQVGLALICVIAALCMYGKFPIGADRGWTTTNKCVCGPSLAAEGIFILDPAEHIDGQFTLAHFLPLDLSQGWRTHPDSRMLSCTQGAYDGRLFAWDEVCLEGIFSHLLIAQDCQFVCGCLARVCELNEDQEFTMPWQFHKLGLSDKNIGTQLPSSGIAADHDLPETKQGKQKGNLHKPSREGGEASSIFRYQTFIFALLCFGFFFMIGGLSIMEDGRVIFGIILAGFGFFLGVYSGLVAISGPVAKHF